jgi:hypothetical protein
LAIESVFNHGCDIGPARAGVARLVFTGEGKIRERYLLQKDMENMIDLPRALPCGQSIRFALVYDNSV